MNSKLLIKVVSGLIFTALLCLCIYSVSFAESLTTTDGFTYEIYEYKGENVAKMTKYTGIAENLTIPAEIDGYTVRSISGYFLNNNDNVKKVNISNGIAEIGAYAFVYSDKLEEINIPASAENVSAIAYECVNLARINVDSANTKYASVDGVLFTKSMTGLICYPAKKDGSTYSVPNTVTSIWSYAFNFNKNLTEVTIPASVTSIGNACFRECSNIKNFKVDSANKLFVSVDGVIFSKDMSKIVCYPAKKEGTSYTLPNTVKTIGNSAFHRCMNLQYITIPSSVTKIEAHAFYECEELKRLTIPSSVTSIDGFAFCGCRKLTKLAIPEGITEIKEYTMSYCDNLKTVVIPASVTSIHEKTFAMSNKLSTIVCRKGTTAESFAKSHNLQTLSFDLNVYYSEIEMTNKDVLVTIISNEEIVAPSGWTLSQDKKTITKTYTKNTTEVVTVKDLDGNTAEAKVDIKWIDKVAPTLTVAYSIAEKTDKTVTVTIYASEEIQAPKGWTLAQDKKSISKTYSENIQETVTVSDLVGNKSNANVSIKIIEKEEPIKKGDVNKDGKVTATDLILAKRIIVGLAKLTDENLKALDINSDGKFTATDLLLLKRLLVGLN